MKNVSSRIENVISDVATCCVCDLTKMGRTRDLDLRGFVCDECFAEVRDAELFLIENCGFIPPSDSLIEAQL